MASHANSLEILVSSEDASFDIVAVHGLNPLGIPDHALQTWTASNGKIWLRDFLPATLQERSLDKPDTSARILCYNYNANVAFQTSKAGVTAAAESLLNLLYLKRQVSTQLFTRMPSKAFDNPTRDKSSSYYGLANNEMWLMSRQQDVGDRPIVFICHSLGGIVVKHALVLAKLNYKYTGNINGCTKILVFMGTPHRGGNHTKLGSVVAAVARATMGNPKNDLMISLTKDSFLIEERSNFFRHQLEDYSIISIYEDLSFTLKGRGIGRVVEQRSATFGLPGFREQIISLQADHSNLCKYESEQSPLYIQVAGNLKDTMQAVQREMEVKRKEADEQASHRASSAGIVRLGNHHWLVHRIANPLFTGQEGLIQGLERILIPTRDGNEPRDRPVFVISGMGGVGKSECALQFAQTYRNEFWGIFWIDCSTPESAQIGYQNVAKVFSVHFDQPHSLVDTVKDSLANCSHHWLLVLDNCDNPEIDYGQYLPSGLRGAVLITSRLLECERYASGDNKQNLTGLPLDSATDLVLKAAKIETAEWNTNYLPAKRVAIALGRHPLAILLAGAYISDRICSLQEYPEVFQQQASNLLNQKEIQIPTDYGTVYTTFEMSVLHLANSNSEYSAHALHLLHVIAHMHRQGISESIFTRAWTHELKFIDTPVAGTIYKLTTWHMERCNRFVPGPSLEYRLMTFKKARSILCKLSLANFDLDRQSFSLHPLIHVWAKERLTFHERLEAWITTGSLLALSTEEARDYTTFSFDLQPHLEVCYDTYVKCGLDFKPANHQDHLQVLRILFCCVMQLLVVHSASTRSRTESLLNEAISLDLTSNEAILSVKKLYGRCLFREDDDEKAVKVFEDIVNREVALPPDDRGRLRSRCSLAEAYLVTGRKKEAIELLEENVAQEALLPPDDPDYLSSQTSLGLAHMANGQYGLAADILKEVFMRYSHTLTADHPERLMIQVELARACSADQPSSKALKLIEEVVIALKSTLPSDHSHVVSTEATLARAYLKDRKLEKATEMFEDIMERQAARLPTGHPDLVAARHDLACVYIESNDTQKAKKAQVFLEENYVINKRTRNEDHPHYLGCQHQLACAYFANKEYHEAAKLLEKLTKVQRKVLQEKHPDRINSQEVLAMTYVMLNRNSSDADLQKDIDAYRATRSARSSTNAQRRSSLMNFFQRAPRIIRTRVNNEPAAQWATILPKANTNAIFGRRFK